MTQLRMNLEYTNIRQCFTQTKHWIHNRKSEQDTLNADLHSRLIIFLCLWFDRRGYYIFRVLNTQ